MKLSILLALDHECNLGYDNDLVYHSKKDMKRFKELTLNKTVIMGRKTYESLPVTLKNRKCIIISSTLQNNDLPTDYYVCSTMNDALELAEHIEDNETLVIGGKSLYIDAYNRADTIYLTLFSHYFSDEFDEYNDGVDFDKFVELVEYEKLLLDGADGWTINNTISVVDDVTIKPLNVTKELTLYFMEFTQ